MYLFLVTLTVNEYYNGKKTAACPKSPSQETIRAVTVEAMASPRNATADKITSSQTTGHKHWVNNTESGEKQWVCSTVEATARAAMAAVKVGVKTYIQAQTDKAGEKHPLMSQWGGL